MRYSPKPIHEYGRVVLGKFRGPATNSHLLKDDLECWNLAFLSYDYDKRPVHPEPQFTSLVRKTVSTSLATGELSLAENKPLLVRSLLRLPAPQFVKIIEFHSLLTQLPLYKAFGNNWLSLIKERSWLCATHDEGDEEQDVESITQAQQLLAAITKKR